MARLCFRARCRARSATSWTCLLAGAGLLLGGCNDDGQTPPILYCYGGERELGAGESSSLGISAEELFALAESPLSAPLVWRAGGPGTDAGAARLELTAVSSGTPARERTSAFNACPSQLEADMLVELRSTDDVLAGHFDALLVATAPGYATLQRELDRSRIADGSFSVAGLDGIDTVAFSARFSALGAYGGVDISSAGGNWSARFPDTSACWPDGSDHGLIVAEDADLGGFDAASTLESLRSRLPTRVAWDDGSVSALTLGVAAAAPPCATIGTLSLDERWSLRYPVSIDAASEDGRWHGRYQGVVSGQPSDGGFILASLRARLVASPAEFAASAGVPTADVGTYQSGQLDIALDVDTARDGASGEVLVRGVSPGTCLPNPEEPSPPGSFDDEPCDGLRRERILRGTFGL